MVVCGRGLGLGFAWEGAQGKFSDYESILYNDWHGAAMDGSFVKTHQMCILLYINYIFKHDF